MNRRQFCKTSVAAGVAATFPLLAGCGDKATMAVDVDTSIAAVALDGAEIELERAAIKELADAMHGPVMLADHADYDSARTIWNGMHLSYWFFFYRPA